MSVNIIANTDKNVSSIFDGADAGIIEMKNGMLTNSQKLFNANTALHEKYKSYSQELQTIAKQELVGVGDLLSRGLSEQLPHVGVTLSYYEKLSDVTPADVSMDGQKIGNNDKVTVGEDAVPVPVFFKDFGQNFRHKAALQAGGSAITSATNAQIAYQVSSAMEEALFNGNSKIVVAGHTIPGYTNFADRNTYTLPKAWTSATGDEIITYLLAMIQKLKDQNFYGPYVLYIPNQYSTLLEKDYSTAKGDNTIRARILAIPEIASIRTTPKLANNNVLLVQMDKRVVDVVIAQPLSNIILKSNQLQDLMRTWAIMIHRLKSSVPVNGVAQCGICHGSV